MFTSDSKVLEGIADNPYMSLKGVRLSKFLVLIFLGIMTVPAYADEYSSPSYVEAGVAHCAKLGFDLKSYHIDMVRTANLTPKQLRKLSVERHIPLEDMPEYIPLFSFRCAVPEGWHLPVDERTLADKRYHQWSNR